MISIQPYKKALLICVHPRPSAVHLWRRSSEDGFAAGDGRLFPGSLAGLHFAPKAKRVIYLFQSGGPSQMDLFDPKPELKEHYDQELPDSIRKGQRITTMTLGQKRFPVAPSIFKFQQHGESRQWLSELLPHTASIADKLCIVKSMVTQAINHDPAITFFQTGSQIAGRPSMGAWASYGLGKANVDLPAFVAMTSRKARRAASLRPALGKRFSTDHAPGREIPRWQRSGPLLEQSSGGVAWSQASHAGRRGRTQSQTAGSRG